jgi:hypothetical protein
VRVSKNRCVFILRVGLLTFVCISLKAATEEEPPPSYTLNGGLSEIRAKTARKPLDDEQPNER